MDYMPLARMETGNQKDRARGGHWAIWSPAIGAPEAAALPASSQMSQLNQWERISWGRLVHMLAGWRNSSSRRLISLPALIQGPFVRSHLPHSAFPVLAQPARISQVACPPGLLECRSLHPLALPLHCPHEHYTILLAPWTLKLVA